MRPYLINLLRRPDRLEQFRQCQKLNGWNLPEPEVIPAVDGWKCPIPRRFKTNGGAWGCTRSHMNVFELALSRNENEIMIFEDDACWNASAWERLDTFLKIVPDDWQMLMIGGQHMGNPIPSEKLPGLVRCRYTTRTHAYIVRGEAIKELLLLMYDAKSHVDHHYGLWQARKAVYAPSPFIFGQVESFSDITCQPETTRNWS